MSSIYDFYNSYSENDRLFKRRSRSLERLTAFHFLKPYISSSISLADIGCATGAYCLELASQVNSIYAVDLIPRHIEQLKEAIIMKGISNIKPFIASACNLDFIKDSSIDLILCFGPFYHIQKESDRNEAIKECFRILKPGGILFANYINKKQTILYFTKCGKPFNREKLEAFENNEYDKLIDFDDFLSTSYCTNPDDIENELMSNGFEIENHISLDSIAYFLSDELEKLNAEDWTTFLDYHYRTCENRNSLEMSSHGMIIAKK